MNINQLYVEQYNIVNGVSNYQGKIKSIMNKCCEEMKKCEHMYNEKYVWHYQKEILDKALNEIGAVMESGYKLLGSELEKAVNKLPKDNPNPTYTTHDLVKMQRLQMQLNVMSDQQIEQVIEANITDSFTIDICKNELFNRSKVLEGEEKVLRQAEIRGISAITNEVLIANAKKQYEVLAKDVNNSELLFGMSIGERAAVMSDGGVRQHILKMAGINEPIEDPLNEMQFK